MFLKKIICSFAIQFLIYLNSLFPLISSIIHYLLISLTLNKILNEKN